jgi:hypothetical protein
MSSMTTDGPEMWKSKLGNLYEKKWIEQTDKHHLGLLRKMRIQPANASCVDCGTQDGSNWAVVSLGSFVCVRCASIHRGIGTHISKVKGCSGRVEEFS